MVAYGAISIGGGALGYARKGSVASVVAGTAAGILLIACAYSATLGYRWALGAGLVIAVALVGRFVGATLRHRQAFSFANVTGATAVTMIVGGIVVAVTATMALIR